MLLLSKGIKAEWWRRMLYKDASVVELMHEDEGELEEDELTAKLEKPIDM